MRGGARPGAGRKAPNGRRVTLAVKISKECREKIDGLSEELGISKGRVIEELLDGYTKMAEG